MSAKANKLLVQGIFEALGRGDRTVFLDALHDDLVMQVMGSMTHSTELLHPPSAGAIEGWSDLELSQSLG